jgi:8-oxo-dGTP pyrophosphatase MutT (NUDIX family)/phosphohistidine phosphatase SixA
MPSSDSATRAAGVVLLREHRRQQEFLAIHRPKHDDWSLPKGKLDPGEHPVVAAVRECQEETGYLPILGPGLSIQEYLIGGAPKQVMYWTARVRSDLGFAPNDEVDSIAWTALPLAHAQLSYPADALLVRSALAFPPTSPLIILRHAQALKRAEFNGKDDQQRPLSARGEREAVVLPPIIDAFGVVAVHSSPARRCLQTVTPLAAFLQRQVIEEAALSEEGFTSTPEAAVARALRLLRDPKPAVICTHRPVLPAVMGAVREIRGSAAFAELTETFSLRPGAMLILHRWFGPHREPVILAVEQHDVGAVLPDGSMAG